MASETLERRFAAVGARLKIAAGPGEGSRGSTSGGIARGEYFDIGFAGEEPAVELAGRRRQPPTGTCSARPRGGEKSKFLCGHDERHWFVAAVPEEARGVTGVATAKEALQPARGPRALGRAQAAEGSVSPPERRLRPPGRVVLRARHADRPAGRARVCATSRSRADARQAARDAVRVSARRRDRLRQRRAPERDQRGAVRPPDDGAAAKGAVVRPWFATPSVYAKGAVRHPDHATIHPRTVGTAY